jgi:hypothetical protein
MTLVLVFVTLALVWLSGLGATLLLLRSPASIPRLLICPFVGTAASVLLFFFLLPLNLTGPGTAGLDMALLAGLAAAGLAKSPLRREDWSEAWPVLLVCSGGFLLAAWPLLASGYHDYMAYGNPDVPFFLTGLRYFSDHPLRLPDSSFYRGLSPGGIVGVLFYAYQVAIVTKVSVEELFSTVCAAIVFLSPCSVYLLCRTGLAMDRRKALVTAGLAATSSLLAYTFYLNSLGTLTVMTSLPAVAGVAILYFRTPERRYAILLAMLLAGSLYNYFTGTIVLLAVCGAVGAAAVVRRGFPRKRLAVLGIAGVAAVCLPSLPYAKGIIVSLFPTASQPSLAASANEIQTTFALVLTERGAPFFWGLEIPFGPIPQWSGRSNLGGAVLLAVALLLFAIVACAFSARLSGLPAGFRAALAALAVLVAYFYVKEVAYGVFKLVAWVHFLFLAALAGVLLNGLSKWRGTAARAALGGVLVSYAILNGALTVQLGRSSLGLGRVILSSVPGLRLSDLRAVEGLPRQPVIMVGFADDVIRRWATPFLGSHLEYV